MLTYTFFFIFRSLNLTYTHCCHFVPSRVTLVIEQNQQSPYDFPNSIFILSQARPPQLEMRPTVQLFLFFIKSFVGPILTVSLCWPFLSAGFAVCFLAWPFSFLWPQKKGVCWVEDWPSRPALLSLGPYN